MTEIYIGGTPQFYGSESNRVKGSPDSLDAWLKSAIRNPAPVKYKLHPIEEILMSHLPFSSHIPGNKEILMSLLPFSSHIPVIRKYSCHSYHSHVISVLIR